MLLCGLKSNAQKNDIRLSLNSSFMFTDAALINTEDPGVSYLPDELIFIPSLQFKKGKHLIFAGYDFLNKYGYAIAGYQFYADSISKSKRLLLYFPIDLFFKSIKTTFINTIWINSHLVYSKINTGIGLRSTTKFGLFFNAQSGIGLKYIYYDYKKLQNGVEYTYINNDFYIGFHFLLGIGYEFKIKKK